MIALLMGMAAIVTAAGPDQVGVPGSTYPVVANTVKYTFRLDSASFATEYVSSNGHIFAWRGNKLLLVSYTIGNPGESSVFVNPGLVGLGLADGKSAFQNISGARSLRFAKEFGDLVPGQTTSDTAYLEVPNSEQAPQLLVRVGSSQALRFDLSGRVKPLAGPFALSHGLVASDEVFAKRGQPIHIGALELGLEDAKFQSNPIGVKFAEGYVAQHIEAAEDQRILVARIHVKNRTKSDQSLSGAVFPELRDSAGNKGPLAAAVLRGDQDLRVEGVLRPGQSTTVRAVFLLPKSFTPSTISLIDEIGGRRCVTIRDFVR